MLKRVLMSVDFPRPDSPGGSACQVSDYTRDGCVTTARTNDHCGELEALPHAFPVHLIGEVGEANVSHELFADDWGDASVGALR